MSSSDSAKIRHIYSNKIMGQLSIQFRLTKDNGQTVSQYYYTNSICFKTNGSIQGFFGCLTEPKSDYKAFFVEFRSSRGSSVVFHKLD